MIIAPTIRTQKYIFICGLYNILDGIISVVTIGKIHTSFSVNYTQRLREKLKV